MKDVTKIIRNAISKNQLWSISIFPEVIDELKKKNIDTSYWVGEENWATILINNRPIGYIWKKYPLVTIDKDNACSIKNLLKKFKSISYLKVVSLDADLLKISDNGLMNYLDTTIDLNSFTVEELWFNTNSI